MKLIKKFSEVLKPAAKRFSAAIFMGFVAAVFSALFTNVYDFFSTSGMEYDSPEYKAIAAKRYAFESACSSVLFAALFSMLTCIFLQLLFERFARFTRFTLISKRKEIGGKIKFASALPQIVGLILFIPAYFVLKSKRESDFVIMAYFGLLLVLFVLSFFLLLLEQREDAFPSWVVSGVIASVTSFCVGAGLVLIRMALSLLLQVKFFSETEGFQYMLILGLSFFVVFASVFLACATKKREDISVPKVFKAIILYALLPVYLILLLILYLYLLKSLVTWTMPSGKINPLVSAATAIYLLFYFSICRYRNESKFARIFCSKAVLILYPLIALQCLAFGIRIHHYGFTTARYASLFYIILSIIFCILPLVKSGKYMSLTLPILSAFILICTVGPFNAITIPQKDQMARLENVFKRHGLFEDGKINAEKASEIIPNDEKSVVASSYKALDFNYIKNKPAWYTESFVWSEASKQSVFNFEKAFGFKCLDNYDEIKSFAGYNFKYDLEKNFLDVSDFSLVKSFDISGNWQEVEDIIIPYSYGSKKKDITDFVRSRSTEKEGRWDDTKTDYGSEPIRLETPEGIELLITYIYYSAERSPEGNDTYRSWTVKGFETRRKQ